MTQTTHENRRIVLAERPSGLPNDQTFRIERSGIPKPGAGEMLLKSVYLSLDPYMRGRLDDAKSYAEPVGLGEVMVGQAVAQVVTSDVEGFSEGDHVLCGAGWQDYMVSDGSEVYNLGQSPERPSWHLGVLGMPGYTAYAGLLEVGLPKPGETVVVAAASGPVGGTVGQIAKLKGCRVVGIAGGPEKCRHVVDTLGFDTCLDHRSDTFRQDLASACPDGIDVYFENVGGRVLYSVLPLLNPFARVPVCGIAAWYNLAGLPEGRDFGPLIMSTILKMKVTFQGFIITESFSKSVYHGFLRDMAAWVESGEIAYREQIVDGLEHAPRALNDVLTGRNFGKMVIRL